MVDVARVVGERVCLFLFILSLSCWLCVWRRAEAASFFIFGFFQLLGGMEMVDCFGRVREADRQLTGRSRRPARRVYIIVIGFNRHCTGVGLGYGLGLGLGLGLNLPAFVFQATRPFTTRSSLLTRGPSP